jgi:hypothetical protein
MEVVWWRIELNATLSGVNRNLGVRWLPHQLSHACDDVSTVVFERVLVIATRFHIVESGLFPLPESQIKWHPSHELLDSIFGVEAWETPSGVFFLQHV